MQDSDHFKNKKLPAAYLYFHVHRSAVLNKHVTIPDGIKISRIFKHCDITFGSSYSSSAAYRSGLLSSALVSCKMKKIKGQTRPEPNFIFKKSEPGPSQYIFLNFSLARSLIKTKFLKQDKSFVCKSIHKTYLS